MPLNKPQGPQHTVSSHPQNKTYVPVEIRILLLHEENFEVGAGHQYC